MNENPYASPVTRARSPVEDARRSLAFWLYVLGGWTLSFLALTVYSMFTPSPDMALAIDSIYPLLYAGGSFWIAVRVRRGQGVKAARYLLLTMIPLVAGEFATPIFAVATGIAILSPLSLFLFLFMSGHIYSYATTWRWLIRLNRETASNPAA